MHGPRGTAGGTAALSRAHVRHAAAASRAGHRGAWSLRRVASLHWQCGAEGEPDGRGGAGQGFSGRLLRKLPFLTHTHLAADSVRFEDFVAALSTTCELERADRATLT